MIEPSRADLGLVPLALLPTRVGRRPYARPACGYEDDEDDGEQIICTGAGGNDPRTGKQIADQTRTQHGNAGMVLSEENGYPVRVMRGFKGDPAYSPASGYRYDGMYHVDQHWSETGKSGFRIWRFRMIRLSPAGGRALPARPEPSAGAAAARADRRCRAAHRAQHGRRGRGREAARVRLPGLRRAPITPGRALRRGSAQPAAGQAARRSRHPGQRALPVRQPPRPVRPWRHCIDAEFWVRDHTGAKLTPLSRQAAHPLSTQHLRYHRERFGHT